MSSDLSLNFAKISGILDLSSDENAKLSDLIAESKELSRILSASVATTKKRIGG